MDENQILAELSDLEVVEQAKRHYTETEATQAQLRYNYMLRHQMCYPPDGDQWPEDENDPNYRDSQIHMSANIIHPSVAVKARLQAKLPRLNIDTTTIANKDRKRAEAAEQLYKEFLTLSEWDIWMNSWAQSTLVYGRGALKTWYNKDEKRPEVRVIEQPENLRLGWGASDFSVLDWALYEYSISPIEARRRWPDLEIEIDQGGQFHLSRLSSGADHSDPLNQSAPHADQRLLRDSKYTPSQYEEHQIVIWDYWYKDEKSVVRNAIILNGETLATKVAEHPELIDIPYIVEENEHELGSPNGVSMIDDLQDIQVEFNRLLSNWCQLVAEETGPAWQITGENANLPDGFVPKSGEAVNVGDGEIKPIQKPVNIYPAQQLAEILRQSWHEISGLPEISFGLAPGTQTAGRALAVQVDAVINRLEDPRNRMYRGLRKLLIFWGYMLEKVNPKIPVDGEMRGVGTLVKGFRRWNITAPEITPRDVYEVTQNEIAKVNAKLSSLHTSMNEIGQDSPEHELETISQEQGNIWLFPGTVQTVAAVVATVAQLLQQNPQIAGVLGNAMATANDTTGQGKTMQQMFAAQPQQTVDQNGPNGPFSQPGTTPPPGGPAPAVPGQPAGAAGTVLVRPGAQGQGQALNQLQFRF